MAYNNLLSFHRNSSGELSIGCDMVFVRAVLQVDLRGCRITQQVLEGQIS